MIYPNIDQKGLKREYDLLLKEAAHNRLIRQAQTGPSKLSVLLNAIISLIK